MDDIARDRIPGRAISLLDELKTFSSVRLDVRAENSWAVAVKFFNLLEAHIPDEDQRYKIMLAWFKAVKQNDFRKFQRAMRRYRSQPVE